MKQNIKIAALLAPSVLILLFLFVGGIVLGVMQSLNYMPLIGLNNFNFDAYKLLLKDPGFISSVLITFWVSIMMTILCVVFAILTALALRRSFKGKKSVMFFYQVPITIPVLVAAIGISMILTQSGLLSRIWYQLGFLTDPSQAPELVYDRLYIGVIIVYLWIQIPFVGLIALSILQSVATDYESVARSLGANKWQTFRHVILPLVIPGILPASIICFAYSFGAYEVPYILGRTHPAMLSVLSFRYYKDVDLGARSQAMATSVCIVIFIMILVYFYNKLMYKLSGRKM